LREALLAHPPDVRFTAEADIALRRTKGRFWTNSALCLLKCDYRLVVTNNPRDASACVNCRIALSVISYNVGLCRMTNGSLTAPYEGASIEAANIFDALRKAKEWAASVEVADNSWLQILLDGRSVRSQPGSF
jgi:hypothetical protein